VADVLVQRLLSFALDGHVADPVALQAIRDALDRAGLNAKTSVGIGIKPYEAIFEQMESGGSRAKWRRSQGIEDNSDQERPALPPSDDDLIVDAEVMDEGAELIAAMRAGVEPITPDQDDERSDDDLGPLGPTGPASVGMMSLTDAVEAQAAMRRDNAQRALPRGR